MTSVVSSGQVESVGSAVKDAINAVYATMDKYAKFGAYDTEPRAEFADVIIAVAEGNTVEVPQTARQWQLYSGMKGSKKAARKLTRAAARFVTLATGSDEGRDAAHGYARRQGWVF